jgi:hypothetical protein
MFLTFQQYSLLNKNKELLLKEWISNDGISFGGTGVWTEGFALARQVLYAWAMLLTLFDLIIFEIGSHFFPSLDHHPPVLCFLL